MTAIFISYSRKNDEVTYELANVLREHGYTVWTDVSGIPGGSVWQSEIEAAITNCHIVIVVMSPAARESEWVSKEILFALDLGKSIIPVMVESVKLPLALITLQPIQYTTKREQGLSKLLSALPEPVAKSVDSGPVSTSGNLSRRHLSGMSLLAFRQMLMNRGD